MVSTNIVGGGGGGGHRDSNDKNNEMFLSLIRNASWVPNQNDYRESYNNDSNMHVHIGHICQENSLILPFVSFFPIWI